MAHKAIKPIGLHSNTPMRWIQSIIKYYTVLYTHSAKTYTVLQNPVSGLAESYQTYHITYHMYIVTNGNSFQVPPRCVIYPLHAYKVNTSHQHILGCPCYPVTSRPQRFRWLLSSESTPANFSSIPTWKILAIPIFILVLGECLLPYCRLLL